MALMVLSSLRYASYRAHEEEIEQKRLEKLREQEAAEQKNHRGDIEGIADVETQREAGKAELEKQGLPARSAAEALAAN